VYDARTLVDNGCHGLIIENFHDAPFFRESIAPELVASMTVAAHEVRRATSVPIGINVLRNSWQAAMAVASVVGGAFIRVNVLTDALVTDQGIIQGCAAELSRYRAALGSEVLIFADILCKHAAPIAARPIDVAWPATPARCLTGCVDKQFGSAARRALARPRRRLRHEPRSPGPGRRGRTRARTGPPGPARSSTASGRAG
jgi:membrane complex biogenesis BtpA family protein